MSRKSQIRRKWYSSWKIPVCFIVLIFISFLILVTRIQTRSSPAFVYIYQNNLWLIHWHDMQNPQQLTFYEHQYMKLLWSDDDTARIIFYMCLGGSHHCTIEELDLDTNEQKQLAACSRCSYWLGNSIAIHPDGNLAAYSIDFGSSHFRHIWIHNLRTDEAIKIATIYGSGSFDWGKFVLAYRDLEYGVLYYPFANVSDIFFDVSWMHLGISAVANHLGFKFYGTADHTRYAIEYSQPEETQITIFESDESHQPVLSLSASKDTKAISKTNHRTSIRFGGWLADGIHFWTIETWMIRDLQTDRQVEFVLYNSKTGEREIVPSSIGAIEETTVDGSMTLFTTDSTVGIINWEIQQSQETPIDVWEPTWVNGGKDGNWSLPVTLWGR